MLTMKRAFLNELKSTSDIELTFILTKLKKKRRQILPKDLQLLQEPQELQPLQLLRQVLLRQGLQHLQDFL